MVNKLPSLSAIERSPWYFRALLGAGIGTLTVGLTYAVGPLRALPLLLAFPAVVLAIWFFGIWGGVACALIDAVLVEIFLSRFQFHFSIAFSRPRDRLALFLTVSLLVGWAIRILAGHRMHLYNRELRHRLRLADVRRQVAEESARASEATRDRDALLQIAFRANGMAFWVWDLQNNTTQWSDEVYRIMGIPAGSVTPSKEAYFKCLHPEDAEAVAEAVSQAIAEGNAYHRQYRVIWPDGTVRWIDSRGQCQHDPEGRPLRIMGILVDVTNRKRSEEAMLRAEKLAIAGRLAASVAHEINNPLEAITNLLYLTTLTDSLDDAKAHARQALQELMRVSLITQSTLKFHRQTGAPKLIQMSEVVDSVMVLFRAKIVAAEINVDVRVDGEVPVSCMPSEAQQMFANLIANAIDAMSPGGRLVIRLRASRDWRNGSTEGMRITFCDSGSGMDRATMRRIFEPFYTTKPDTGTGLGMWVVMQLIERHHGQIHVWSSQRPGSSGTAFSVFLPRGTAPETYRKSIAVRPDEAGISIEASPDLISQFTNQV